MLNDWIYVPYNHLDSTELKDFITDLQINYPVLYEAFDKRNYSEIVIQIRSIGISELKVLYQRHYKDMNCSSMAVYSAPFNIYKRRKDACLYTGDYPMRYDVFLRDIKQFYACVWDTIGTLQVPHHGSDDDNPETLYESFEHRTCVISAGSNNKKHPGRYTLLNIVKSRSDIRLVTEDFGSLFAQTIKY